MEIGLHPNRNLRLALGALSLCACVSAPAHAASVMVTLTVPVRCDISLIASGVESFEEDVPTNIGLIEGSCNVPHSIALTTPEWPDYRGEFTYEGNTQPFAIGRTTFRKREGARIYATPLEMRGEALDRARTAQLASRIAVVPAL